MNHSSKIDYKWVILSLITLTHVMNIFSANSPQPLAPFLQSEFHLKHFQIGMLTSLYFMGALVLSIPMGWLVDRVGVYWMLAAGQVIVGSFILSISLANSYSTICWLLFFAGMGHATLNPATGKAVIAWFSRRGRATAMGVKQTGIPIGGALAAAIMPALALAIGWRKTFAISGTISLLSVLLCILFYKPSREEENYKNFQPVLMSSLRGILKNRDLMLLSGLISIFMGLQMSLQTYLILFCKDRLLFPVIKAGFLLSLTHLGGVVGRIIWGAMSDFFFQGRRKIVLVMIGGLSSALCLSFAFLSPEFPEWLIVTVTFLFGLCAMGWNGTYLTLVAELAGEQGAGMATGVSLCVGFVGVLYGPPFFGYIVDCTQSYSYSWSIFSIMIGLATLLAGWIREPVYRQIINSK